MEIEMKPFEDYISELSTIGLSHNYQKNTSYALKKYANSLKGKDPITATEDDFKAYIQDMRGQRLSERTLVENVKAIERFYDYVVESRKYNLTFNPTTRISKRIKLKKHQTRRPEKTIEDIGKFIKSIHNVRDRAIVVLLAKTGIRNGELVSLDVSDVDFIKETVSINKHIGDHEKNIVVEHRKNGNDTIIPIDEETIRTLKFYLASRPIFETSNPALFLSYRGERLFAQDITRTVKEWSIKSGLGIDSNDTDKKITPHYFRAFLTYNLALNGCNPSIIDNIRGDVATNIRNFYTNQVLPFDIIKRDFLRCVPIFGI
jgi:integrase